MRALRNFENPAPAGRYGRDGDAVWKPSASAALATASTTASAAWVASATACPASSSEEVSRVADDLGSAWVKARDTSCRAEVSSLGITQNVFPGPWASCGSIWRY